MKVVPNKAKQMVKFVKKWDLTPPPTNGLERVWLDAETVVM